MEHVQRRFGRYYWRARVPTDLVSVIGRREIVRRLGTADPRVTRERAAVYHARVIGVWTEARVAMSGGATAEQVRNLVARLREGRRGSACASDAGLHPLFRGGAVIERLDYAGGGLDLSSLTRTAATCGSRQSCRTEDLPARKA